jgi:hypothetical protein
MRPLRACQSNGFRENENDNVSGGHGNNGQADPSSQAGAAGCRPLHGPSGLCATKMALAYLI